VVQQVTSHRPPLRPHPRTDENGFWPVAQRYAPSRDSRARLVGEEGIKLSDRFGFRVGDERQPVIVMVAPQRGGIADIMELSCAAGQEISIASGRRLKSFGATGGERQQVWSLGFTCLGLKLKDRGSFLEHHMGVGAAEAERVHPCQGGPISRRPCLQRRGNT
jgi:hypothetical protein